MVKNNVEREEAEAIAAREKAEREAAEADAARTEKRMNDPGSALSYEDRAVADVIGPELLAFKKRNPSLDIGYFLESVGQQLGLISRG